MKTAKTHWPAFLIGLLIIGFVVYWIFFRNKSKTSVSPNGSTPSDSIIGSDVRANKDSVNIYTDLGVIARTINNGDFIGAVIEQVNGGELFPGKIMYKIANPVSGREGAAPYFLVWNQDVEKIIYS